MICRNCGRKCGPRAEFVAIDGRGDTGLCGAKCDRAYNFGTCQLRGGGVQPTEKRAPHAGDPAHVPPTSGRIRKTRSAAVGRLQPDGVREITPAPPHSLPLFEGL